MLRRLSSLVFAAATLLATPRSHAVPLAKTSSRRVEDASDAAARRAIAAAPPPPLTWATALSPLTFTKVTGGAAAAVRLYDQAGGLDPAALATLDELLAGDEDDAELQPPNRRLLRLIVKAADHFHERDVRVVSQWRPDKRARAALAYAIAKAKIARREPPKAEDMPKKQGSRHATGEAMDLLFPTVPSPKLAAYLRSLAKVGVGIYTNRRTGFVHLDVRDDSFHWVDSSPPGRSYREMPITDRQAAPARDRAYRAVDDLPDGARVTD